MCSTSPKEKIVIKYNTRLVRNRSKEEDEILKEKAKKFDLIMEKKRINHKTFYKNKYMINDNMSIEEMKIVLSNKKIRNDRAKEIYKNNPEIKEKAKQKATSRYVNSLTKEQKIKYFERKRKRDILNSSNKIDISSSVLPSNL